MVHAGQPVASWEPHDAKPKKTAAQGAGDIPKLYEQMRIPQIMSHKATQWAFEQQLPALQKLVLVVLADRHNKDTGRCDPSIARVAEDCGMGTDAVRTAIRGLKEKGLLTAEHRFFGQSQLTNSYGFNFGGLTPPPLAEGDPSSSRLQPPPPAQGTPNREVEPGKEPPPLNPAVAVGVPAAGSSGLKDGSHMIAKAVVLETGLSGPAVYEAVRAQAEFELSKTPGDQDAIRDGMVQNWKDYEKCSIEGKLKHGMFGAAKFFGEGKWKNSKLWGLKDGQRR